MKLLKLVPDNTNIDFMKWRNIAQHETCAQTEISACCDIAGKPQTES